MNHIESYFLACSPSTGRWISCIPPFFMLLIAMGSYDPRTGTVRVVFDYYGFEDRISLPINIPLPRW